MKTTDKNLHIIVQRLVSKVNENDIKTVVPIVIPISKELIGYLKL